MTRRVWTALTVCILLVEGAACRQRSRVVEVAAPSPGASTSVAPPAPPPTAVASAVAACPPARPPRSPPFHLSITRRLDASLVGVHPIVSPLCNDLAVVD